ncbi:unnamed protein product [Protopolystoma xenopodis]|uniref:Uncharacterized protein n=1 Tax=Protopolystoma xenopodis TaxID=117903 RepID=A0A3S5B9P0_9PLAT|nr:unnamed protein product [Protopolystoma xenopodis]
MILFHFRYWSRSLDIELFNDRVATGLIYLQARVEERRLKTSTASSNLSKESVIALGAKTAKNVTVAAILADSNSLDYGQVISATKQGLAVTETRPKCETNTSYGFLLPSVNSSCQSLSVYKAGQSTANLDRDSELLNKMKVS